MADLQSAHRSALRLILSLQTGLQKLEAQEGVRRWKMRHGDRSLERPGRCSGARANAVVVSRPGRFPPRPHRLPLFPAQRTHAPPSEETLKELEAKHAQLEVRSEGARKRGGEKR